MDTWKSRKAAVVIFERVVKKPRRRLAGGRETAPGSLGERRRRGHWASLKSPLPHYKPTEGNALLSKLTALAKIINGGGDKDTDLTGSRLGWLSFGLRRVGACPRSRTAAERNTAHIRGGPVTPLLLGGAPLAQGSEAVA